MAGKVASILIKILADASGVKKETDEAESAISKIGGGFKSAMVPATAALAGFKVELSRHEGQLRRRGGRPWAKGHLLVLRKPG